VFPETPATRRLTSKLAKRRIDSLFIGLPQQELALWKTDAITVPSSSEIVI
jgi:hypothetical protein